MNCPNCGKPTEGTWSEGGVKRALCLECLEREYDDYEEREALRAVRRGEWMDDDGGIRPRTARRRCVGWGRCFGRQLLHRR